MPHLVVLSSFAIPQAYTMQTVEQLKLCAVLDPLAPLERSLKWSKNNPKKLPNLDYSVVSLCVYIPNALRQEKKF
ncbi:MAG: hypothetical protein S4CHLAM123_02720 [Chlamydiales bacterium]|nr:hypothetical protein [Chlamydiales bacterium]